MTSKGERDRDESSAQPECVTVQELEDNVSLPILGGDNPKLGTKALPIRAINETLQSRCVDCGKKRDHSYLRLEPHSAKSVKTRLSDGTGGVGGGVSVPSYEHYKRRHASDYWRKLGACLWCGSNNHWVRDYPRRF
ncbi:hypothetical protein PVK06_040266 [Gossypium arboreum]|uniref:Uncharacterized protein n=1 Tax=Gossypium arboreum TaxID=29729 RepID=A0ABR0N4Z8_GOSAR|nr:hypothetical protein PVK06_040266 [Gossypium arboreum]